MSVVGYLFQLENATTESENVEQQERSITDYAADLGLHLEKNYIEKKATPTSALQKREAGSQMLAAMRRGDVILVSRAEWVLSSAQEGLWLVDFLAEKGISLFCRDLGENISLPMPRKLQVSEGGAELVRKILTVLSATESCTHGESIKAVKRQMKEEGKYVGGPVPFGWVVDGEYLIEDREQQKIIDAMRKMKANRWSYRDIAKRLNEQFGISLSHEGVRKILLKHSD